MVAVLEEVNSTYSKTQSFQEIVEAAGVDLGKVHEMTVNISPGGTDRYYINPDEDIWIEGLKWKPQYNLKITISEPLTDEQIENLCGQSGIFTSIECHVTPTPLADKILADWRKQKPNWE